MAIEDGIQWEHDGRTFTLRPELHLFRFSESREVADRETGELRMETSDFGLLPGGAYVEIHRLLQLARERVDILPLPGVH